MNDTYDYKSLVRLLISITKAGTGKPLVEAVSAGKQPNYPFYTYDFIDTYQPLGFTDNIEFEPFEMSLELEAHSEDNFETIQMASNLAKLLQTQNVTLQFDRAHIYVIDVSAIEQTDNELSVQVERRAGFVLDLRVVDSFTDDVIDISDININGSNLPKAD